MIVWTVCALILPCKACCCSVLPWQCWGSVNRCIALRPWATLPASGLQIIVLSNDDAITVTTNTAVRGVVNQFTNPNGCNVPFTFFVSGGASTSCAIASRLLADNHELASHTLSHAQLVPGAVNITDQIAAQIAWMNTSCGIPSEKIVGFRAPYLLHNPQTRAALQSLGLKWDSSIIESWPSTTSPSSALRLWPYSMASGVIQNCQWMLPSTCSSAEKYALWEVLMLQFESANGTGLSSMDPTADTSEALLEQLMMQFNISYQGNKAPFGIYLHTSWFAAKPFHAEALTSFIRTVLAKGDVYFLTYSQLVDWMKAPVGTAQMASWLTCKPVDFAAEERPPCTTYTVQDGDSLYSISAEQEVELADLLALNSLTESSPLYIGMRMRLPPWTDACPDSLAGQTPCRNHTVQAGEYLWEVARSYNLTVDDVVAVNANLTASSALSLGQVLRIPPWPPVECMYGKFSAPVTPAAPAPAPAAADDDAPTAACGPEMLEIDLTLTGFDSTALVAHLPQLTSGLGSLLRVPAACVSLSRITDVGTSASGQRRLLAQRSLLSDPQVLAVFALHTDNSTQALEYLRGAQMLGSLGMMLNLLGGQVDKVVAYSLDARGSLGAPTAPPAAAPVASPAASPASSPQPPTAASDAAVSSGGGTNVGAIVGGVVGGVCGGLLVAGLGFFIYKRRQAAASGGKGGLRSSYAIQNPTYGATASISTRAPGKDMPFELAEVVEATGTPRSARRRNHSPFSSQE